MTPNDSFELFPPPPPTSLPLDQAPLADRMRPRHLRDVVGQAHLLGPNGALPPLLTARPIPSLILWGPPGVGKTTIARLLADSTDALFTGLSGVEAGVKEMRQTIENAKLARLKGKFTILFLDEIHRLTRSQQDALLPHVETGIITLLGATTENPSFQVISPLLSRCKVYTLEHINEDNLGFLIDRALTDHENGLGRHNLSITPDARQALITTAGGDARRALGILEAAMAVECLKDKQAGTITGESVQLAAGTQLLLHDKDREEHYNTTSALIKSLRASDPDAALYYLARMLEAGEDPLFIARRLIIFAAEDVGNADPAGFTIATSTYLAIERIGLPEGRIPLAQTVTYLATANKSNASYIALGRAQEAVRTFGNAPVPMHLRNAPTSLMKKQGYGEGYKYPHDEPDAFVNTNNLPSRVRGELYYEPTDRGEEQRIAQRLAEWRLRRSNHND